jgi:transposase
VKVQAWALAHQQIIERTCGLELRETDLSDDRLGIVLGRLSEIETWISIETALSQRSIRVYELRAEVVRLDATTINGYHLSEAGSLFQFGHSKDDPSLPQIKVMMGTLDPLGMPLATQVVAGEQADDGLYLPVIGQITQTLPEPGLLFVGDSKMSALVTRATVQQQDHYYLMPLPMTGKTPELLDEWITAAVAGQVPLQLIERTGTDGAPVVIAEGYELSRAHTVNLASATVTWTERVCVIYSPAYAQTQTQNLAHRLQQAETKLLALTPPPGRGKRRITTETLLQEKIQAILQQYRVNGLLQVDYECQVTPAQSGQSSPPKVRYQMTQVRPQLAAITATQQRLGWKVYATNAPIDRLSLAQAVLTYRDEWSVERGFHRLKGAPLSISPLFVQRDHQVVGLTHLLTLALRLLTLIEFVVRRQLKADAQSLAGLYPENPKKQTDHPTAERLLRAFSNLTLTILEVNGQQFAHSPPLSQLQAQIIQLLGLPPDLYSRLSLVTADNAIGNSE